MMKFMLWRCENDYHEWTSIKNGSILWIK